MEVKASPELKLYRIRESAYGKEKDYVAANAYVAAISHAAALRIFARNFGEPEHLTIETESTRFLIGDKP